MTNTDCIHSCQLLQYNNINNITKLLIFIGRSQLDTREKTRDDKEKPSQGPHLQQLDVKYSFEAMATDQQDPTERLNVEQAPVGVAEEEISTPQMLKVEQTPVSAHEQQGKLLKVQDRVGVPTEEQNVPPKIEPDSPRGREIREIEK